MIILVLLRILFKVIAIILLSLLAVITVSSLLSPIYNFPEPKPFSGDIIYNPYADFDTSIVLKKGNFHAHSKLPSGMTNGTISVGEVRRIYREYGYDVIGISNYQTISVNDPREEYKVPLYEHGYNFPKFHQLVFGKDSRTFRDCNLPITTSACQSIISYLAATSDAVCINHPRFTYYFPVSRMKYLRGYRFIEADAGMSPAFEWWDEGLSSGIPSFMLSGDDSHNVSRSGDFASHCVFISTLTSKYADVMKALKAGNFYSMRIPNFGDGDLDIKHIENARLPTVEDIGIEHDSIFIKLSRAADSIKFIGQDGQLKKCVIGSATATYPFSPSDTYIRTNIIFSNGIKIYTNPTFRTDTGDPFADDTVPINLPLTILMNLFRVCSAIFFLYLIVRIVRSLFRWK